MNDTWRRKNQHDLVTDEVDGSFPLAPIRKSKALPHGQEKKHNVGKMATADVAAVVKLNGLQKKKLPVPFSTESYDGEEVPRDVKECAKDLAKDIIPYVAYAKSANTSSKYCRTLRRTVDELSERHEMLFKGMVNKLNVTERNLDTTFQNVADEIFQDNQYNWGRIVAVYAFAGRLAKYCVQNNMEAALVDKIIVMVGDYVANRLGLWVHTQGGWEAFTDYFPEKSDMENTIWKGLLFTAFGLGALATMVAAR